MSRFASLIIAAAAIVASPALAATYSAKPAVQPQASRIIARDISWVCGPDACQGSTEASRAAVLCQGLAKRAGRLESFIANGRAFGGAELDQCNASAKRGPNTPAAVATASAH